MRALARKRGRLLFEFGRASFYVGGGARGGQQDAVGRPREGIVLGKVVEGTLAADLKVGMEMELTTMPLFVDDDGVERVVHAWRIAS